MTRMQQFRRYAGIALSLAVIAGVAWYLMALDPQRIPGVGAGGMGMRGGGGAGGPGSRFASAGRVKLRAGSHRRLRQPIRRLDRCHLDLKTSEIKRMAESDLVGQWDHGA